MAGGKCPMGGMDLCSKVCELFVEEEQTCCMKVAIMPVKSKPKSRKKKEDK